MQILTITYKKDNVLFIYPFSIHGLRHHHNNIERIDWQALADDPSADPLRMPRLVRQQAVIITANLPNTNLLFYIFF